MIELIPYLDLTRLEDNDSIAFIDELCKKAHTPFGDVAAVCIYPAFVKHAKLILENSTVRVATVANFPAGDYSCNETLNIIHNALQSGADEVDVVLPYHDFLAQRYDAVFDFLAQCRQICENTVLKVILETGALQKPELIKKASDLAIEAGADFLKTSTGKIKIGATVEAAKIMLTAIKEQEDKNVGLKVSGGVRTVLEAKKYWDLVVKTMGHEWVSPRTFRIGASVLLEDILFCHARESGNSS